MSHANFEYMNKLGTKHTPFLFIIDFLKENVFVNALDQINPEHIQFTVNHVSNSNQANKDSAAYTFEKHPISFETFKKGYDIVYKNLQQGNSYLTNYTAKTPISTDLSLQKIYQQSKAKYKLWFKDQFVVFSPEAFIKITDGKIYSYPMKGTINASIENAEHIILSDPKEMAEHATITDLIRNDLSRVATKVSVEKYRYVDRIKTNEHDLLQVSSEIRGELPADFNESLGTILNTLLPAGSISGAPKEKTLEIIRESESYERKYYTGVFGIYDGKNLDCGVMIRFIEKEDEQLFFKSGGGITIKSDARKEYQEMINKVYLSF